MKTKIRLFTTLIIVYAFLSSVNAQLRVSSAGNVGICLPDTAAPLSLLAVGNKGKTNSRFSVIQTGKSASSAQYGIYSELTFQTLGIHSSISSIYGTASGKCNKLVGVSGYANNTYSGFSSGRAIGVYGAVGKSLSGWGYGVVGLMTQSTGYGTGIFGTNEASESYVGGRYAGYFKGETKVNGDFYCNSITTTSDARFKTNITEVRENVMQKLQALHPIQFNWQQVKDEHNDTTVEKMYFSDDTDYDRLHYGFIAQDVQKLFPNLVHEDADGYLGVNYMELIPILVQAIQTLSYELESLNAISKIQSPYRQDNMSGSEPSQAVLYQNIPNPFTIDTKIAYFIPNNIKNATLHIYDLNGSLLAEYPITSLGEGSTMVSSGTLDAGMYLYALIADGQVVDTKHMILTK
ncbi:MAG: tail fiber domain-containing protein [Paludibacteraceae bacterium]|nr:tail fiber domain-containing protein [Paludibacteraceae bacterium]